MKELDAKEFKDYLSSVSKEELIEQMAELFTRFGEVNYFYQIRLNSASDDTPIREKYEQEIRNAIFPKNERFSNDIPNITRAEKAVSDYKRVATSNIGVVTIMLFYIETVVDFINTFGDIDEPFYESIETTFENALKLIVKDQLKNKFEEQCRLIADNASDIGYGSGDELAASYKNYFEKI